MSASFDVDIAAVLAQSQEPAFDVDLDAEIGTAPANPEQIALEQAGHAHALRMLFWHVHHYPASLVAQDVDLFALQAPHHHRIVGGDENLRVAGSCVDSTFTDAFDTEHCVMGVTKNALDVIEVAQLPDRI